MPWDDMPNEFRHRIKDPSLFEKDSFVAKELQKKPANYAIMGKLKGEKTMTIQSLRFPKSAWSLDEAKKWMEDHRESVNKYADDLFKNMDEIFKSAMDCCFELPDAFHLDILPGYGYFVCGSEYTRKIQERPCVFARMGRMDGCDCCMMSRLIFPKVDWKSKDEVCQWFESNRQNVMKSFTISETDIAFIEKANLTVQAFRFDKDTFDENMAKSWLASKKYENKEVMKSQAGLSVEIQPQANFMDGSLRDIVLREGVTATVGLLKKECITKGIAKKVPDRFTLKSEDLNELYDLDIVEVTLTKSPMVGKMAEFRIVKSLDAYEETYSQSVPIWKVDKIKKQVGAYVAVPDLPDYSGDIASKDEIEKAAHSFMRNLALKMQKGTGTGLEHVGFGENGYPVESFLDETGVYGVPGGWWLTTQITKSEIWKDVESGKIVGYSLGGTGKRRKAAMPNEVAKTVDAPKEEEKRLFARFIDWFRSEKVEKIEEKRTDVIKDEVKKGEQKMNLTVEFLEKYDLKPSEVKKMQENKIDIQAAYESAEKLLKALNFDFSLKGLGTCTKDLIEVVNRGEFGKFPTPETAWNANSKPEIAKTQPEQKSDDPVTKMMSRLEAMELKISGMEGKGNPGVRKSMNGEPPESVAPTTNDMEFDALDNMDISYNTSKEILKRYGVRKR